MLFFYNKILKKKYKQNTKSKKFLSDFFSLTNSNIEVKRNLKNIKNFIFLNKKNLKKSNNYLFLSNFCLPDLKNNFYFSDFFYLSFFKSLYKRKFLKNKKNEKFLFLFFIKNKNKIRILLKRKAKSKNYKLYLKYSDLFIKKIRKNRVKRFFFKGFFNIYKRRSLYKTFNFFLKFKKNYFKIKKKIVKLKNLFIKKKRFIKLKGLFNLDVLYVNKKNFYFLDFYKRFFFIQKIINFSVKSLINNNFFLGDFIKRSLYFYCNFYLGFRLNFLIFNIEYTVFLLRKSLNFILDSFFIIGKEKSSLLFCDNFYLNSFFFYCFSSEKQSYITGKWVNGFFTNFKTIKKSFIFLKNVRNNLITIKYLKEKKLMKKFEGLKDFYLPFLFLISEISKNTKHVLYECKNLELPLIGLLDSNSFSYNIAYPIPCNNSSFLSIRCFFILFKRCLFLYSCLTSMKLRIKKALSFFKTFYFFFFFIEKKNFFLKKKCLTSKEKVIIKLYSLYNNNQKLYNINLKKEHFKKIKKKNFYFL